MLLRELGSRSTPAACATATAPRGAAGRASTDLLVEQHLGIAMDFESVPKVGTRLGTGTVVVLDDRTCPVGVVLNLGASSRRNRAAGARPAGRTPWAEQTPRRHRDGGEGKPRTSIRSIALARSSGPALYISGALAMGAAEPLQSALKLFRADFERHISEKRCPWR